MENDRRGYRKMVADKNKIRIERNDATTSHNGNILVEIESYDLSSDELEKLAIGIVEKISKKRK